MVKMTTGEFHYADGRVEDHEVNHPAPAMIRRVNHGEEAFTRAAFAGTHVPKTFAARARIFVLHSSATADEHGVRALVVEDEAEIVVPVPELDQREERGRGAH